MLDAESGTCSVTNFYESIGYRQRNIASIRKKITNTPAKLDKLKRLPQRKLLWHVEQDKVTYLCVDVSTCNYVYIIDKAAFQRLRHLVHQKKIEGLWTATIDCEGFESISDYDFPNFED